MFRLCPGRAFPPYSYVPGHFPHPMSDPAGHSYQLHKAAPEVPGEDSRSSICLISNWKQSTDYLFGIDLFNYGFYWEAHETWEQVWIELGRSGRDADFIKSLIKLAAAGVKAREGRPMGVRRHAERAGELLLSVSESLKESGHPLHLGGLHLPVVLLAAKKLAVDTSTGSAAMASDMSVVDVSNNRLTSVLPVVLVTPEMSEEQAGNSSQVTPASY